MSKILHSKISKVKIAAMMLMIIALSIWFALHSQPVKHITPDIVMRRESLEITAEFEEAINASLRLGDGRIVNWQEVRGA